MAYLLLIILFIYF